MGKRSLGGILLLVLGLLFVICSLGLLYTQLAIFSLLMTTGLSVAMLHRCKHSDVMADTSAAIIGCSWGVLLGICLAAGLCKLSVTREIHPYDENTYGIIVAFSLLLTLITLLVDMIRHREKQSLRRFALQCAIALSLVPAAMGPAWIAMLLGEIFLSRYV